MYVRLFRNACFAHLLTVFSMLDPHRKRQVLFGDINLNHSSLFAFLQSVFWPYSRIL